MSDNSATASTLNEKGDIISVNLLDAAKMISTSVDLMEDGVYHHGQRVAYIAYRLFQRLYPGKEPFPIVLASFLHDIGINSHELKKEARNFIVDDAIIINHTQQGEMLLDKVDLLRDIKAMVRHHHTSYNNIKNTGKGEIPVEAEIISLADRVEVLIKPGQYILDQRDGIIEKIKKFSGTMFNPKIVHCFMEISGEESFWLDIDNQYMNQKLWDRNFGRKSIAYHKDIRQLASLCAEIVDRKSPFTYAHSKKVASISKRLGEKLGMDDGSLFLLEIAGELHDIGKLSIPSAILHKTDGLSEEEYRVIRQHTYHTYYLIDRLNTIEKARDWAAFHHEKLDGSGYPFRLKARELDLGSRVLAIADITTALSEDRPYRKRFYKDKIMEILWDQVKENKIDGDVVRTLEKNYRYIVTQ